MIKCSYILGNIFAITRRVVWISLFFPHEVVNQLPAVVWGHGSLFSIDKYVLDQAKQLKKFQTPVYSINPCSLTLLRMNSCTYPEPHTKQCTGKAGKTG